MTYATRQAHAFMKHHIDERMQGDMEDGTYDREQVEFCKEHNVEITGYDDKSPIILCHECGQTTTVPFMSLRVGMHHRPGGVYQNLQPPCKICYNMEHAKFPSVNQLWVLNNKAGLFIEDPLDEFEIDMKDKYHVLCTLCDTTHIASPAYIISRWFRDGIPGCTKCRRTSSPKEIRENLLEEVRILTYNLITEDSFPVSFGDYNTSVRKLTESIYDKYKKTINPGNKIRGSGEGEYHLDHILSVKECYKRKIPPALCANPENLQMITGSENQSKSSSTPVIIPIIFESYLQP